jgi:hypothetical protein
MNANAIAPLIATIVYFPLLLMTINSRPFQRRHLLFLIFLISAMLWSFDNYLGRGVLSINYTPILFRFAVTFFALTAVQFHTFMSSFYPKGENRWLPFAYGALAFIIVAIFVGWVVTDVYVDGAYFESKYSPGILLVALPLVVLAGRNFYVFRKIYRQSNDPVQRNQAFTLLIAVSALVFLTAISIPSWFNYFPFAHYGNLVLAFILSYGVVRHKLIDIKLVLRKGTAWAGLILFGLLTFWVLLFAAHSIFRFQIDFVASLVATLVSAAVSVLI